MGTRDQVWRLCLIVDHGPHRPSETRGSHECCAEADLEGLARGRDCLIGEPFLYAEYISQVPSDCMRDAARPGDALGRLLSLNDNLEGEVRAAYGSR